MLRLISVVLLTITASLASNLASATTAWVSGAVTRVHYDTRIVGGEVFYGGCAVTLSNTPTDTLSACGNWVSFSCVGEFNSKSEASAKYNLAQLAFVTGRNVAVNLNDQKLHNGHCFAEAVFVVE